MTYILGITGPVSYNQAAVLLRDGEIVAASEEERFSRIKHHRMTPPFQAISSCLKKEGISQSDIESVAVGWGSKDYWRKKIIKLTIKKPFMAFNAPQYMRDFARYSLLEDKLPREKMVFYPHHLSHMACAYLSSGMKKSNIISLDEVGETQSTVLGIGKGDEIEILKEYDYIHSLGRLYRQFTEYLGFLGNSDEYKVMGLSAYGTPKTNQNHLYKLDGRGYSLGTNHFYLSLIKSTLKKTLKILEIHSGNMDLEDYLAYGPARKPAQEITPKHKDIAATAQEIYEKILLHISALLHQQTGYKNFCIAGGCGLNCLANGKLLRQDYTENLFVPPVASDAGSALGAALLEHSKYNKKKSILGDVGLGPAYTEEDIELELSKTGFKYERHDDVSAESASLLAKNRIIGWFQGGMEFGPRALGHRSILANPTFKDTKDRVNRIKNREMWRPLAPSIASKHIKDFFEIQHYNEYMTVTQEVKYTMRDKIPSVVHADGSARYQSVGKDRSIYYDLITQFQKMSGVPVVLNTSLNKRGEPIVDTPHQALSVFSESKLDALVLGNYVVYKNDA
ncbi:MAG: hypothetical protein KKD39_08260 [Candidatus Altiarchaeota archaeon]|nr:hypothetical protein [Candidatus Altiarchaeota archaeon]